MPTLHCQLGDHDYLREPMRGRLPDNCKDHKPVVPEKTSGENMVELFCDNGSHKWQRAAQRGRRPESCPDHPVHELNLPVKPLGSSTDASEGLDPYPSGGDEDLSIDPSESEDLDALEPVLLPKVSGVAKADRLVEMMINRTRYGNKKVSS